MAVKTQQEYNRLRAELDALTANKKLLINNRDEWDRQKNRIEGKLKEFKPKTKPTVGIGTSGRGASGMGPRDPIAGLIYSEDPNSPFQKALDKVRETSGQKAADALAIKKAQEYESGYKSEVKSKKDAQKKKEDADKKARELEKWQADNAISLAKGLGGVPKPDSLTKTVDPVVAKDTKKVDIKLAEQDLGWVGYVPMGPQVSVSHRGRTATDVLKVLSGDATKLYVNDPKIQKQVLAIMQNSGVQVDGVTGYLAWQEAVTKSAELSAGGKGYVITPMEVLQSQYGTSKGPTTSTNKSIVEYTSQHMGTIVDKMFQEVLGKDPTPAQRNRYVVEFQKLAAQGNVSTTTTTGSNSTTKTKYGFSEADEAAKLGQEIKASPEYAIDYKQRQALDFNDAFNRIMAGGL